VSEPSRSELDDEFDDDDFDDGDDDFDGDDDEGGRGVELRVDAIDDAVAHLLRGEIEIEGPLDDEQRQRLLQIADRCPVHRTLTSEVQIRTRLNG